MDGFVGLKAEAVRDISTSADTIRDLLLQYCDDKTHTACGVSVGVAVHLLSVNSRTKAVSQG